MSDSAEGNGRNPRLTTGESAPKEATLEPEAADQFASSFVPAWQFGSAGEREAAEPAHVPEPALNVAPPKASEAAAAYATESSAAVATDPFPPPRRHADVPVEPSVVIADDLVREVAALHASRTLAMPAEPTQSIDDRILVRTRPRKALFAVVGASVAVVLSVLGVLFARAESRGEPSSAAATAPASQAARPAVDIPPPSPPADTTASAPPPAVAAVPPPALTPTPAPPPPAPSRVEAAPVARPSRQASAAQPAHAPEPSRPPRTPKSSAKTGAGGIVRDNPF